MFLKYLNACVIERLMAPVGDYISLINGRVETNKITDSRVNANEMLRLDRIQDEEQRIKIPDIYNWLSTRM